MARNRRYLMIVVVVLALTALFVVLSASSTGHTRAPAASPVGPTHVLTITTTGTTTSPVTTSPTTTTVRSTISPRYGACARDDRGTIFTAGSGASGELVEPDAIAVTVCRYNGMNPFGGVPDWALRAQGTSTDQAAVARDAAALDRLRPFGSGAFNCPSDDGSAMIATFRYRTGADAVVRVNLGGCGGVTNGSLTRQSGGNATAWLEDLAHPVKLTWSAFAGKCAVRCPAAGYVRARINGSWLAFTETGPRGRFRLPVALPGTYTLQLVSNENKLLARTQATVRLGQTTFVTFYAR